MPKEHNAFENQIFDHYRKEAKKVTDAIQLLVELNYTVIDHQGNWLNKKRNEENKTTKGSND